MINIYEWTRIDNLPLSLNSEFEYLREEAELLGEVEEWEVYNFVEEIFERDFPQFFKTERFDRLIEVEYYPFERDYDMAEDEFPGYAVYIHMHSDLVYKMVKHILNTQYDYIKQYFDWFGENI